MKKLRLGLAALLAAIPAQTPLHAETIVLGGYPDQLMFVDETSGIVTQKVTLDTGLPMSMHMSNDKKRLYVTTLTSSGIEILDTATRKITSKFSLNDATTKYRFNGGVPDPSGRYFYIFGTKMDKQVDAYRISKPQYMVVDLKLQKIVRTAEIDKEDEGPGYRTQLVVSPDGKTLYVFGKKVVILDTATLKVIDRINLEKPDLPGMRDVNMGGSMENLHTPNEFVSLFNSQDPYVHNKIFGIARFNLTSRQFSFSPIGPAPDAMAGLQVTPDGKQGYTVVANGKLGAKRCEFWHFDLTTNQVMNKAEFPCRSRFTFGMSANGEKLYIYAAGYEVEVFDARTLQPEQTWALTNDIIGTGMVFIP